MAHYKNTVELNYSDLPQHTKYRFAELEMYYAVQCLEQIFRNDLDSRAKATQTIFKGLFLDHFNLSQEIEQNFFEALTSNYFNQPRKEETILYLRYKNISYTKIVKAAKTSPNTIAKVRFQGEPNLFPIFQHWNETFLAQWNIYKRAFNLFEEELIHW